MGVTGLWTVVQPCARPAKLETLNKKRLAVDASIWIYQFLKAVRDKEGNALRNSHVVGFFRRICKLLFVGIKPVFVFDGGAPILKRQTVSSRKARREGRREDAVRTAGKLLAVQMQRRAEEDDKKRRVERDRPQEQENLPDEPVYVEEIGMTVQEKQQNRSFKKKDAYHLPDLDVNFAEMGAPNDPRIMSHEELEEYARQFHTGEDVNIYDFSKIDFNSDFFTSLPASDRYNILNAARLRSRLRMGYSKEQLDTMFPDRMAFSRFQIERVKERNELTQRLMNINGMVEDGMFGIDGGSRIAGEKGKEYVLVKNEGVEGGWALGVVSNKNEGERNQPIDVEKLGQEIDLSDEEEQNGEDDGFEDIPIEGLNRLPRRRKDQNPTLAEFNNDRASEALTERRKALYASRQQQANHTPQKKQQMPQSSEDPDSLFVPEVDEPKDDLFEDVPITEADEDEQLQQAIAMSLDAGEDKEAETFENQETSTKSMNKGPDITKRLEFNAINARYGRDFAHQTNARANQAARRVNRDAQEDINTTPNIPTGPRVYGLREESLSPESPSKASKIPAQKAAFAGPLPFESLDLGKSILSRKKKKVEEEGGGFDKDLPQNEPAQPLPPWFSGDVQKDTAAQKRLDLQQYAEAEEEASISAFRERDPIRRQETKEIIDVDAPTRQIDNTISVESSEDEDEDEVIMSDSRSVDRAVRMGDVADLSRVEPPKLALDPQNPRAQKNRSLTPVLEGQILARDEVEPEEEAIEWDESDVESNKVQRGSPIAPDIPLGGSIQQAPAIERSLQESASPESSHLPSPSSPPPINNQDHHTVLSDDPINQSSHPSPPHPSLPTEPSLNLVAADASDEEDQYSDPEDADLFRQLAEEASEHARFASSLSKSAQSAEDYERELRQLRNQQKKDRRDADEVSHIMITECQQLLKLFGIPYITAPMEAEAQCAELVRLGLVDGIVTDDSDIFLFGGTRVYKNMFNQAKFVECYLASDLEKEYALTRQKLISIAHLLGSDYTEGLPSVGPVTALEILSDFGDLQAFARWWEAVQTAPPPPPKSAAAQNDPLSSTPFRRKFRKTAATKLFLPPSFPNLRVDAAYLDPEVDSDPSGFEWGVPDLDALRAFLMATIGWTQERADEILVPVIRDMNRREVEGTQANITKFFGGGVGVGARERPKADGEGFAPRRKGEGKSKRMENALGVMAREARKDTRGSGDESDTIGAAKSGESANGQANKSKSETRGKRKSTKRKRPRAPTRSSDDEDGGEGCASMSDDNEEYRALSKVQRKKAARKQKA